MIMDLNRKIDLAIHLLQSIPTDEGKIEVCYSTGKDSDVILELAKMSGIPYEAIYKNTTCDRPGSMTHAREMGATIRQPKHNFLQLIENAGWPSRWMRFCCKELKEYKIYDRAIVGIRRCESGARARRYKEPERCRIYSKNERARQYLPILEWSDEDVERFIKDRGLKCHPHYYDENGKFCVQRRVGCIGCPLQADKGIADFKEFPHIFRARARAYAKWMETHPDSKSTKTFPTAYHALCMKLFFDDMESYNQVFGGGQLFDECRIDPKEYLERYFGIDLTF